MKVLAWEGQERTSRADGRARGTSRGSGEASTYLVKMWCDILGKPLREQCHSL